MNLISDISFLSQTDQAFEKDQHSNPETNGGSKISDKMFTSERYELQRERLSWAMKYMKADSPNVLWTGEARATSRWPLRLDQRMTDEKQWS